MKLGHLLVIFWMKSVGDGSKEVEGFWVDVGGFLGDHFFSLGGCSIFLRHVQGKNKHPDGVGS